MSISRTAMVKAAKAAVKPVRQRTQYTCMSASMAMCLQALGHACDEDEVNKVMGARPMKGAAWEEALACAQHYGCRATLTTPATVTQLKEWTDQGIPVMIAWNPEGRDWSHASVVFDVQDGTNGRVVFVADPNIPNPEKTVREVPEDEFYGKWYEKWPNYLVRRPACAIAREVTPEGRQVMASARIAGGPRDWYTQYPQADSALLGKLEQEARYENAEATNPKDALEMMAWDMGYQGERMPPWMKTLAKQLRVDIDKEYRAGVQSGKQDRTAGSRSPNQAGSAVLLKRMGYTPVDFMYGEFLPHRRPIIMQGEELQDQRGNIWFFAGTDDRGKPILAKTERELERMKDQLVQDRLHHGAPSASRVAARYLAGEEAETVAKKQKETITGPAPTRRNVVVHDMVQRGWGSGSHQNRERDVSQGRSRKEKHKKDPRREHFGSEGDTP